MPTTAICWKNITGTQPIAMRLAMAREAKQLTGARKLADCELTRHNDRVQAALPAAARQGLGLYLFSSGDIATFIAATGMQRAVFIDRFSFIAEQEWGYDPPRDWDPEPIGINTLVEHYGFKHLNGATQNGYSLAFKETGIFALLETIDLGAGNTRVFHDESRNYYLLMFELAGKSYAFQFVGRHVSHLNIEQTLAEFDATVFFVKWGNRLEVEPVPDARHRRYKIFESDDFFAATAGRFPAGSYLVSYDGQLNTANGEVTPFVIPGFKLTGTVQVGKGDNNLAFVYRKAG